MRSELRLGKPVSLRFGATRERRLPRRMPRSGRRRVQFGGRYMGRMYLFECSRCGYRARVSGSADHGRYVIIQTILCTECKELYDAVIAFKPSAFRAFYPNTVPKFAALLNRLPPRGVRPWIKWKPVCPVSCRHRIRLWKPPDKCPKCGAFLDPGPIPVRRWD